MKNTILFILAAFFFSASAQAQSTADSIAAKYKLLPMPEPLTIEKTFPVLGNYEMTAADGSTTAITVSLDAENKGIIWIDGLKEGKIKAYLKKRPSIYRIVPQKSEAGKSVAEGTLVYDQSTGVLQVVIGKPYNQADPTAPFATASDATAKSKTKSKAKYYSATKAVPETVVPAEATTSSLQ